MIQNGALWQNAHLAVNEAAQTSLHCVFQRIQGEGVAALAPLQQMANPFDPALLPDIVPAGEGGCDWVRDFDQWQRHQLNQVRVISLTEFCGSGQVMAASGSDAQWFAAHQYMTTAVAEVQQPGRMRVLEQQFWQHRVPRDPQQLTIQSARSVASVSEEGPEPVMPSVGDLCLEYVATYSS